MEQIIKIIVRQYGLELLGKGADLVDVFTVRSQSQEDIQLFRDFVDTRGHTALLDAGKLSAREQANCYAQTVDKLANAVQIPKETAQRVCAAYWHAVHNAPTPPEQEKAKALEREKQQQKKQLDRQKQILEKELSQKQKQQEKENARLQKKQEKEAAKIRRKTRLSVQERKFLRFGWVCLLVHIFALFLRDYSNIFFFLENIKYYPILRNMDFYIIWNFEAMDGVLLALLLLNQMRVYAWGLKIRTDATRKLLAVVSGILVMPLVLFEVTGFLGAPIITIGLIVDGYDVFVSVMEGTQLFMVGVYALYHLKWMRNI